MKNLIGSVRLSTNSILEVEPKVPVGTDWASSVVQLLGTDSRMVVTGSQRSTQSPRNNDLTNAIAVEYARRLNNALASEGPLSIYERRQQNSRRLNGRLDLTAWVRQAPLDPASFPVVHDELTVNNSFSQALSVVASFFRRSAADPVLRSKLRKLEVLAIPGAAVPHHVRPGIANRKIPSQWRKYQPAWDIASAILRNRSVVGDPGHAIGLEVAVAPWPLLETLLVRSLKSLVNNLVPGGVIPAKTRYPLYTRPSTQPGGSPIAVAHVEPDGVLRQGLHVLATFEAKYTNFSGRIEEEHRYQALAAAATLGAPLAVLVYPDDVPSQIFDVHETWGCPRKLAVIGLSLYSYQRQSGAGHRAKEIHKLLKNAGVL